MKKKTLLILVTAFLFAIALIIFCDHRIVTSASGKLYTNTETIPFNKVGLLLGTSKHLRNGTVNLYYQYRIDAAVALYKAGKIQYILVSGDNRKANYNEPVTMRDDLIRQGIDSTHIFLDYAGFRTFDSMIRLREIFGQSNATIISQQFHNERALYIASREHINAIAFNAKDVTQKAGLKTRLREKLARVKVFVDYIMDTKPKFLGEKVVIPD